MKKIAGVYKIENIMNGKIYIGSSVDLLRRTYCHLYKLQHNQHPNQHLQNAWNLYGADSFIFSLVELCERSCIEEREQFHIDRCNSYGTGYNLRPLATSNAGMVWDVDVKARYALLRKTLHFRHTEETKKRIGDAKRGISSYRKGLPLSEEHKRNISKAWEGRPGIPRTVETKQKIGDFFRGNPLSEEHKGKISLATMGKKKSPYHRKHYRTPWNKGLKMSDRMGL